MIFFRNEAEVKISMEEEKLTFFFFFLPANQSLKND